MAQGGRASLSSTGGAGRRPSSRLPREAPALIFACMMLPCSAFLHVKKKTLRPPGIEFGSPRGAPHRPARKKGKAPAAALFRDSWSPTRPRQVATRFKFSMIDVVGKPTPRFDFFSAFSLQPNHNSNIFTTFSYLPLSLPFSPSSPFFLHSLA